LYGDDWPTKITNRLEATINEEEKERRRRGGRGRLDSMAASPIELFHFFFSILLRTLTEVDIKMEDLMASTFDDIKLY
jgi:hypothetical protein